MRKIDTSKLGPISSRENILTTAGLVHSVKSLRPGESVKFTRLASGRVKVDRALTE